MLNLSLKALLNDDMTWMGPRDILDNLVHSISTDTRMIGRNDLFFALRGENFDGHEFVFSALEQGALACVVEKSWLESLDSIPEQPNLVVVQEPLQALQDVAHLYRKRFSIPLVAITGSSGKTTVKEMAFSVLNTRYKVHRNQKSFNNFIGVPLTLLMLEQEHEIGVTEVGTNHFGELKQLSALVEPDIVLFNNIGYAHLEAFKSLQGVLQAKLEILSSAPPKALVVFNADDALLRQTNFAPHPTRSFGVDHDADVQGKILGCDEKGCYTFECQGEQVRLNVPGRHMVDNALAAIALGIHFRLNSSQWKEGINSFHSVDKRMQVLTHGKIVIVADQYNSNPSSCLAALKTVKAIKTKGRKIAILGDMLELGTQSRQEHVKLARHALENDVSVLVLYGEEMLHLFKAAQKMDFQHFGHFNDKKELDRALEALGYIVDDPPDGQ